MATILKVKLAIGGTAMLILIGIAILETNFFATPTITRWSKLSWRHFAGVPRPFGSFGAAIYSSVYLEYDSARKRFVAYAAQNNMRSWVRQSMIDSQYALDHEQCHFNISELHARKLNAYIAQHPGKSEGYYKIRLKSMVATMSEMQDRFDDETNHGVIGDKQRRWEFTIDSLLMLEQGWTTDKLSGAQVYFPATPDSASGVENDIPYRWYKLSKYGSFLTISSFQPETKAKYQQAIKNIMDDTVGFEVRLHSLIGDTTTTFSAYFSSLDSNGISTHSKWIGNGQYLYRARARFPNDTGDTTGYAKLASSFINSLRIVNTDGYWIGKSKQPALTSMSDNNCKYARKDSGLTILSPTETKTVFFHQPIHRDDGALLLPYAYVAYPDSLRQEDVMKVGDKTIKTCPSKEPRIILFHTKEASQNVLSVDVGYVLRKDSTSIFLDYLHQRIEIHPKSQ